MTDTIKAQARLDLAPAVPITRGEISDLVEAFYDRVWADARLGPIFSKRLEDERAAHLARMEQFWASVLLRSGEYHGRPMPKHVALTEVVPEDFARWLALFHQTAFEVLDNETAAGVVDKAETIAASLWFGMFGTPGSTPPAWLKGAGYIDKVTQSQLQSETPSQSDSGGRSS